MKLKINRLYPRPTYTIGRLYVNDDFFCNTLELPWLNNQEDISCIPTGTYVVKMLPSLKHGHDLPQIMGVANRTVIEMHNGSFPSDTKGCVLLGKNSSIGMLTESKITSDKFNAMLSALPQDEEITIEIV